MRLSEFNTLKLAEECIELSADCSDLSKRCLKTIQFGENEVQKGQELTNRERLQVEANDVLAMLYIMDLLPDYQHIRELALAKQAKLDRYFNLSREKGCIDE